MIELFIGTIASGKSTLARKEAKEGKIIINDDLIVYAVHSGNYLLYDKKLKPLYKSIENHILSMAVAMNYDVVVDRGTNMTVASRKRWIGLASSLDIPIVATVFPILPARTHAIMRYNSVSRGRSVEEWQKVAQSHIDRYEKPTLAEGFLDIIELKENWMNEHD